MKRIFSCLLAVIIAFSLAACSQADGSEISTSLASKQDGTASGNILIAYFSWADNAVFAEDVDSVSSPSVLPPGNVQQLQFAPHGGHWCVCQRPPGGAQRPPSLRYFDRLNNNNVMLRCPLHNSVG